MGEPAEKDALAIEGGSPVAKGADWPRWPEHDSRTEQAVLDAVRSSRWTVSWHSSGEKSRERRFAEKFAEYNRTGHCVSVDHGSSALVIALEALGIGPGDEVVVPVMTWVAPVTAVLRVGALPVVADVDPRTGCLTAETVRDALSPATKAVIVVHLACTVAEIDQIKAVTDAHGIGLIEDCSQAHGAEWSNKRVGTFGDIGVFSFQGAKALAAGEGGAAITSDGRLYRKMQMLRADSRRYVDEDPADGEPELVEDGSIMGGNYCMSELAAGLLMDQLTRLDAQHEIREAQAVELEEGLRQLSAFEAVPVSQRVTKRSVYEYAIRLRPGAFTGVSISRVCQAISAELGIRVYPPRSPLNRNVLLRPETKTRFSAVWTESGKRRAVGRSYPGAESYARNTLLFHHSVLLAGPVQAALIIEALRKVERGLTADV